MVTNNCVNEPTAASGKVLQGQGVGTASAFSTATYPSTATSTGTILRADGTNWVASTNTYPNTATTGDILYASGSNVIGNLADVATGQVLTSGGVGAAPAYSATPTVTSITFGSGTALSNYTEGTWTPTLTGGTTPGTTSYTNQIGYYRRIGTLVQLQCVVTTSSASGSGDIKFGALPFTIKNQSSGDAYGSIVFFNNNQPFPTSTTCISIEGVSNTTTVLVQANGTNVGAAKLQIQNVAYNAQWTLMHEV